MEGEVGRFRRNHPVPVPVPVPEVGSLKELNGLIEDACFGDLDRRIAGRQVTAALSSRDSIAFVAHGSG